MIPLGWAPYLLGSGTIALRGEVLSRSRHLMYSTTSLSKKKIRSVFLGANGRGKSGTLPVCPSDPSYRGQLGEGTEGPSRAGSG
jgi:hypothetical protein